MRDWHSSIAKALLENWEMADEIVLAVSEFEDFTRDHKGAPDLTDVLTVAHLVVSYQEHPDSIELNMQGVSACQRMQLDRAAYDKLILESGDEVAAMQQALGRCRVGKREAYSGSEAPAVPAVPSVPAAASLLKDCSSCSS